MREASTRRCSSRSCSRRCFSICPSGRVQEFYGPGGFGAKFREIAHDFVETTKILVDAQPLQTIKKEGEGNIPNRIAGLKPNVPNALLLYVGRGNSPDLIEKHLQALITAGPATYVVFLDSSTEQFVGSASGRQVLAALSDPAVKDRFMKDLQEGGERPFAGMGFLVTESLSPQDSNVVALQKLVNTNADALVIVPEDGRGPFSIIDRNRLVTKLMLKLAGS